MVLACPNRGGQYGGGKSWLATHAEHENEVALTKRKK